MPVALTPIVVADNVAADGRATTRRRVIASLAAAAVTGGLVPGSWAQPAAAWPTRAVKIVVPFPPGGTNDILARLVAQRLQAAFGQTFTVENHAGAGGIIGSAAVAKSAPDGYSLLLASSGPLAASLGLFKGTVPYDVTRDFAAVATIADVTIAVVTNPNFPASSIADLVKVAKAKPGDVRAALPAVGSMHHLLTALFQTRNGVQLNLIPYQGTAPAVVDLMGGHVDVDFENLPAVIQSINTGKLRAIAVASAQRSKLLPTLPTFAELGMPYLTAAPWFAMMAPAGTPQPIVSALNLEIRKMLEDPAVKEVFEKQGANTAYRTEKETSELIASEVVRWKAVVDETGAKAD